MSTTDPFLPFNEPPADPDSAERDIDSDVDTLDEAPVDDPDADRAAAEELEREAEPSFRTPEPGSRLTAEQLEQDLDQA